MSEKLESAQYIYTSVVWGIIRELPLPADLSINMDYRLQNVTVLLVNAFFVVAFSLNIISWENRQDLACKTDIQNKVLCIILSSSQMS